MSQPSTQDAPRLQCPDPMHARQTSTAHIGSLRLARTCNVATSFYSRLRARVRRPALPAARQFQRPDVRLGCGRGRANPTGPTLRHAPAS
eukprot:1915458-Prymnesium_polylepis.1